MSERRTTQINGLGLKVPNYSTAIFKPSGIFNAPSASPANYNDCLFTKYVSVVGILSVKLIIFYYRESLFSFLPSLVKNLLEKKIKRKVLKEKLSNGHEFIFFCLSCKGRRAQWMKTKSR